MSTPFEPGAPPEKGIIPLSVPHLEGNEWVYLKECLDSNWLSSVGPYVSRFENELARRVGSAYAVATVNGTAALHVALLTAGVGPGDEVLVSTLSFIAPANAVRYTGARPVFIDAEESSWQMDPRLVEGFVRDRCRLENGRLVNRETGRRVRALLPVHILGLAVDLDPILDLAKEHDLPVVEDATEGLGAGYKGRALGRMGALGCFSFNGNKLITTGGGGMIVSDDKVKADRARYLITQAKDDPLEYVHREIGFNYRLTALQAALGCGQLENLDSYVERKRAIARAYTQELAGLPGLTPMPRPEGSSPAFWLYTVLLDSAQARLDSRALMRALAERGIQSRPLWQPLHLSPAHQGAQTVGGRVAEKLWREALSLPSSVGLSQEDQARVIEVLKTLLG